MNTVRYPNGAAPQGASTLASSHSNLGASLEKDINDSNVWYRETGRALIYKKPTPVQIVKVDYPSRNKACITEAYYRTPSTTDYNGVYRGRYIDFEAKETRQKTSFPLKMIHAHQIRHLEQVQKHGGIGFFLIRFIAYQKTYLVDAPTMISYLHSTEHSSIPYAWFEKNGRVIREGLYPRLAYLEQVDALYFQEEF